MLNEITRRQHELQELAESFQGLHGFDVEFRRVTRGKPFFIGNSLAWDAVRSLYRTLVIDLAAWIRSIHKAWLKVNIQGKTLADMRASRRRAAKIVEGSRVNAPPDVRAAILRHHEEQMVLGQRAALRRLFGKGATSRGFARAEDVDRLCIRLEKWAENLDKWRNQFAHRYGFVDPTLRRLGMARLQKRIEHCGRLLNDLRLLVDASYFVMPTLDPPTKDVMSRDLLDLILMGSIQYATEQWALHKSDSAPYFWQQRDVHYEKMHARRRPKKTDAFNSHLDWRPEARPASSST